ncbi:MAG: sulfatase [Chloroflexi bacterium]|jgi:N-sulfoglucosamine sulfohydrolase|nr:sulfatase [Chloroflexota bacterium]
MNPPNILYLHSHDTGRYIQPYGHAVPTPHLQRLAEQGVLFRQAFCAAPTCSPSRAALLTGQCAHSSGMIGLAHRGFRLHDYRQHLVHTLRSAGYRSTLIGVQHVAPDPAMIGYDEVIPAHPAERTASNAVEFLRRASAAQPFFLSVGFTNTHRPFPTPAPEDDPRYTMPPAPLPDTPETRTDMAAFHTSARMLDRDMGAVLDALEENGLAENTLVICTTDHGIAFPGMKCNLTDHGIGVMLIMRGPGGFTGGRVCDALVSQVDIFPTLCDLLGIAPPAWLQGRSFLPVIRGEAAQMRDELYAEVTYHAAYEPQRAVRTQRWKYIRRFGDTATPVLPNCDDSPSKDVWLAHGWRTRPVPAEQLYDLAFDPQETCNLADNPAHVTTLEDMRARLLAWMRATDDPLLSGPVPAPRGAQVNDPHGLSPQEPVVQY